ncbi:membrane protein insertion efficiency factor YidD [Gordonia sp. NB41Y]|uniref:membrane protein insertion efficiency factor YidD n=1 Tax=Gordonia sp. NB41Y TaxID=875808 RepID=UPI0002BE4B4D|nr:membrane protein insertion efficiency factor YidD [Gordonia sp. NB41Y]WLP88500.1 membrane protein insertion efficiency factor YidD [Gordonia sp. NB41Y]
MTGTAPTRPPSATDPSSSDTDPAVTGTDRWAAVRRFLYLLPRRSVIFLIELYRTWISPMHLPTCRFEPTCSGYAVEALTRHGFFHGGALAVLRLLKCGPWHKPGYDPVPERGFRHPPQDPSVRSSWEDEADDDADPNRGPSEGDSVRASTEVRDF